MKRISILLLIGIIAAVNVLTAQDSKFYVIVLSMDGRKAYEKLLNVKAFAVGPVGWGAQTSEEELALRALLKEKRATEALKSLIKDASPEGRLYGLLGLRLNDVGAFREAVENYNSDPASFEKHSTEGGFKRTPDGEVLTASGCIIYSEPFKKIVSSIQAGDFDKRVSAPLSATKYSLAP